MKVDTKRPEHPACAESPRHGWAKRRLRGRNNSRTEHRTSHFPPHCNVCVLSWRDSTTRDAISFFTPISLGRKSFFSVALYLWYFAACAGLIKHVDSKHWNQLASELSAIADVLYEQTHHSQCALEKQHLQCRGLLTNREWHQFFYLDLKHREA